MEKNKDITFSESRISANNQSIIENTHYADITFKVKYETNNGQEIRVSGGIEELGKWKPENGLRMTTNPDIYPFWYTTQEITCPVEMEIKYKYLAYDLVTKKYQWESDMTDRFLKVEQYGKLVIEEEKGNKKRTIDQISKICGNGYNNIESSNKISSISPINNNDGFLGNYEPDNEIELRGSLSSFITGDNRQLMHDIDFLSYDPNKIDVKQNTPLTIGLKRNIEINYEEDKFVILTALLPFNIIKKNSKEYKNNSKMYDNNRINVYNHEKYCIVPKYEDELYESLFRIRSQKKFDIYWIGMFDSYEQFYIDENDDIINNDISEKKEAKLDYGLISFLDNEKIYVVIPEMKDYINYWIYISHILGKIFYENKIPVYDDFFINYDKYWDSYKTINELFASMVFKEAKSTGLIMIHDINLSLVSHYISTKNNYAKMGFYFHSLFPSLEVLKSLPYHQELLQSIMLCDLICFHHIEIANKFLSSIQRMLDLYNEVKPEGNIIVNYQGRAVHIHIKQIGIDLEKIDLILKNKEFLDKKENLEKKYKSILNKSSDKSSDKKKVEESESSNKEEKEKYIFFSLDGLANRNKIFIKFQSFDWFYESYLKKLKDINKSDNMDKILEESEEYINSATSMIEIQPPNNENKNLISNNINMNNISQKKVNHKKDRSNVTEENKNENKNEDLKDKQDDKKIKEKPKTNKNININNNNTNEIIRKITKKFKIKKGKGKKGKSKSGINLSQTNKDIQIDLKINKEINDLFINKEPLFIQVLKDSESKIMNIYNYVDEKQKEDMENNYNDIIKLANEINKKYNKTIIVVIREKNYSLIDLYSLYSIGDCYYCLRDDYNSSIQIQSFIYICNYFKKTYDIILNESSTLSPGIKGVRKVNEFDIFQNRSTLEKVFSFNYINKFMNENNINFINNNEIFNWSRIFFEILKKVSYNDNSQKIMIGLGLGFTLMKLRRDFIHLNKKEFIKNYHESYKNIFFLDYQNIMNIFIKEKKENKEIKENVMTQLKMLSAQEKNKIYIISGDKKKYLDENFGGMTNIGLACEYGFFYKKPGENNLETDYHQLFKINNWSWKKGILPILKGFTDRTEGSFIIEKESMLSWVYKDCDPDFGPIQANELVSHINTLLFQNDSIIVTIENEAVNIRPKNVNKGYFVSQILKQDYKNMEFYDLIMVIGDQDGDEEMFKYLNYLKNSIVINSKIYTVTIDKKVSNANYYLNESYEILEYLENLNKEYKNDGNSSSKYSQEIYNMVDQTDEYDLYSKKSQSYYDI